VEVLASDYHKVIAFMGEGCYFGEIGVLLTEKRTCSIRARTSCILFQIKKDELKKILGEFPLQA